MSRWIDAEWLTKYFKRGKEYKGEYVLDDLKYDAPSVDIVFCKDCKLGGTEDCPMDEIDDEYFCNFGEREGE